MIFDDEDNAPMYCDPWDVEHNPTVYLDRAQMKAEESLPFSDPAPARGCWNCAEYDGDRCMKEWNNLDESYYIPDRDDKNPTDCCDDWMEGEDDT